MKLKPLLAGALAGMGITLVVFPFLAGFTLTGDLVLNTLVYIIEASINAGAAAGELLSQFDKSLITIPLAVIFSGLWLVWARNLDRKTRRRPVEGRPLR